MAGVIPSAEAWKRTARAVRAVEGEARTARGAERKHILSSGGTFRVTLTQTGGASGGVATAPSWTYTVARNGVTIGTGVGWADRGAGIGPYLAGTKGLACYVSGTLTLCWVNEMFDTDAECT